MMHGVSNDPPCNEIAAAVMAHADHRGWDISSPPRSPQRSSASKSEPVAAAVWNALPTPSVPLPRNAQRPKQYKAATPSRFCHVCGRKSANIRVAICGRLARGLCRKVICELCFRRYGWERIDLVDQAPDPRWLCPHCQGVCVPKAQCNTYKRTNLKRHLALRERRGRAPQNETPTRREGVRGGTPQGGRGTQTNRNQMRHGGFHHGQRGSSGSMEPR